MKYIKPEMEIMELVIDDIVTLSGGEDTLGDDTILSTKDNW